MSSGVWEPCFGKKGSYRVYILLSLQVRLLFLITQDRFAVFQKRSVKILIFPDSALKGLAWALHLCSGYERTAMSKWFGYILCSCLFPIVSHTAEVCCPKVHLSGFPVWKNLSSDFCIFINADACFLKNFTSLPSTNMYAPSYLLK